MYVCSSKGQVEPVSSPGSNHSGTSYFGKLSWLSSVCVVVQNYFSANIRSVLILIQLNFVVGSMYFPTL